MTSSLAQTVGVDISKDHLDVCLHPQGAAKRFGNDVRGFAALHAWLAPHAPTRVVFKATGAYHRAFERALGSRGSPMVKVNPRQARAHAEALGRRAKTDRVDAAMLARLGASLEPPARPLTGALLDEMKERKARQGRHNRRHAQTHRPRQRPPQGPPEMDPKISLIETDTLGSSHAGAPSGIGRATLVVRGLIVVTVAA